MTGIRIRPELCLACKGYRNLCGLPKCPLLERRITLSRIEKYINGNVNGSSPPSVVVGEHGYPLVRVMIGIPPNVHGDAASSYDNPSEWWGRLSLFDIIRLRSSMVAASTTVKVNNVDKLYDNELAPASVSERPVDMEALLKGKLTGVSINELLAPTPPSVRALSIRINDNPKVPKPIEKLINDDAEANDAVWEAYRAGISVYSLIRALSVGMLGRRRNRRLVPTRWAITAVDSIIGNRLRSRIKSMPELSEDLLFYGEYLGNRFIIVLRPGAYRARWIELWYPSSALVLGNEAAVHVVDEDYRGRVNDMDGGFYAARLSALEYLSRIGKSAEVIIFREVLPEYFATVGNWHIRETVRRAFEKGPISKGDEVYSTLVNLLKSKEIVKYMPSRLNRITDYMGVNNG
ncbi:Nre family DNA repair protein [Caldivirga maquilingensis]|uniref:DNA repair protein n=1 Tax=Caldivirga maquilingensis (strain ATCC 700844 / DSM 13496 / JCM 10307 / IC-167) TaxID=397948 RepID=A8MDV0_CALMQ|nr:Nre family DNA repair protein [Caldivirga maquilingensis]ABW01956.1 Protein of unknown function DUF650 [Caldivirga maquilingensis IC-167]